MLVLVKAPTLQFNDLQKRNYCILGRKIVSFKRSMMITEGRV